MTISNDNDDEYDNSNVTMMIPYPVWIPIQLPHWYFLYKDHWALWNAVKSDVVEYDTNNDRLLLPYFGVSNDNDDDNKSKNSTNSIIIKQQH